MALDFAVILTVRFTEDVPLNPTRQAALDLLNQQAEEVANSLQVTLKCLVSEMMALKMNEKR